MPGGTPDRAMIDRVRLGLIGLFAITLIVFVASAGARSDGPAPETAPGETLSVLGVAPKMEKDPHKNGLAAAPKPGQP